MASQAAVHDPSPERPDSSHSNIADGNEPTYPHIFTDHGDFHFVPAHPDSSPHRASIRAFEDDLATLPNQPEPEPSVTMGLNHETGQPSQQAPAVGATDERAMNQGPLPDGLDHEPSHGIRDPFQEQTAPSALSAQPTSPTSVYQDEGLLPFLPSQPPATSTPRTNEALQHTSPMTPPTSEIPLSTPSLPAPIPAFHDQRATPSHTLSTHDPSISTTLQAPSLTPPNPTTPSHTETIQPTTSANSHTHNHHPPNPRDRRRRRFVRWVRRRFRRQLPWLEGWLHRREGSQRRREARMAIEAAENAGFR